MLLVLQEVAGRFEFFALLGRHVALGDGARIEVGNDAVHLVVQLGRLLGGTGDDQRRSRLVNQDAVHLVDDGEMVSALDVPRDLELHVVAQVVESEFVVRSVGDVAGVGGLPFLILHVVLDHTHRHSERGVDASHPLGVTPGQVVVDGNDVYALARQGVEVGGERGDQRLAFTGLHLGDRAAVQHNAADQLYVEVAHLQVAPAGFPDDRERLRQQVIQSLAAVDPCAEFGGLGGAVGSSESAWISGSRALISTTCGCSRFSRR